MNATLLNLMIAFGSSNAIGVWVAFLVYLFNEAKEWYEEDENLVAARFVAMGMTLLILPFLLIFLVLDS